MTATWEDLAALAGEQGGQRDDDSGDQTGARAAWLRSQLLTGAALRAIPAPEPLIDGLLNKGALTVLWGRPGAGKSFIALDWAASIASGSWWFGRPAHPGPVLYVAAEGSGGLGRRLAAWETSRHVDVDAGGRFHALPVAVNFLDAEWVAPLIELAVELGPVLIVVDTLARVMVGGDENAARDMGRLVDSCGRLISATGSAVKLVHHDTKAGETMRGSSALLGAVDMSIECRADGQAITLRCEKSKDAEPFETIRLWLRPEAGSAVLGDRPPGDGRSGLADTAHQMLTALRDVAGADGATTSVWRLSGGVAERSFYRWQQQLVRDGLVGSTGVRHQRRYTLTDQGEHALDG